MFEAIQKYMRRREYRKRIESNIHWILIAFPPEAVLGLLSAYPGVSTAADHGFEKGDPPDQLAVVTTASILADFVEKLPYEQRRLLSETLSIKVGLTEGDRGIDTPEMRWVQSFLVAETQVFQMLKGGRIESDVRRYFASEVIGALEGKDAGERSADRVRGILYDALKI